MKQKLEELKNIALDELSSIADVKLLDNFRVKYLGKKSEMSDILKQMGKLSTEERPIIGQVANEVRTTIEAALKEKMDNMAKQDLDKRLLEEKIDVTMPGEVVSLGKKHPLSQTLDHMKEIFLGMGFNVAEGPEVEKTYYNFEALNIPENHPARDEHDTFYIDKNTVLRTHTSPVQVRYMENNKPPIRIIAPGKVYRSDTMDATHSYMFNQVEGLVVDKGVTMSDLKGTLEIFAKTLYGNDTVVRFRPHHFPFTEPSAEMDLQCYVCGGKGCNVCKQEGWIEILGCGMVHPKVLSGCGIDPEIYSGFAFGIGLERVTMGNYDINDIRLLYENDYRFLKQF